MDKKILITIFGVFSSLLILNLVSAAWSSSLNDGLVAYYDFEETSGNLLDLTSNGFDGSVSGSPVRQVDTGGNRGYGYVFDGTNDYIEIDVANPLINSTQGTVMIWFNATYDPTNDTQRALMGSDNEPEDFALLDDNDDEFRTYVSDYFIQNNTEWWAAGDWVMIAVTWDYNTNTSFYLNGTRIKNASAPTNTLDTGIVWIGGQRAAFPRYWDGVISEVGVWNRSLTDTEITNLYNAGDGQVFQSAGNVQLISPANNTEWSSIGLNFTANYTTALNFNITNVTYYVWNATNTIFNKTVVTDVSGTQNSTTLFIDSFSLNEYFWNVFACSNNGTADNCEWAEYNYTFNIGATILTNSYDAQAFETQTSLFSSTIEVLTSTIVQSAHLYYNGTKYIATVTNLGSGVYNLSKAIDLPLTNTTVQNSFFWNIVYTSPSQTTQNLSELTQTVNPIYFDACNTTLNITALNFSLKEEGTFNVLNGSLEFSADYWLGNGNYKKQLAFSNTSDNNTNYAFCISPVDKDFYIDDIVSYYKSGYDRREYFLNNATLNNVSTNIDLYLMQTLETDIFTFTVLDENEDEVQGAFIRIQRWDIATNNFYTVGMIKTTEDGTGIINMRLNDAWYRYQVLYDGELKLTTEPTKESGTSRTLQINLAEQDYYSRFNNIDYTLTYNNQTNLTVLNFADTTGSVAIGCLRILKFEQNSTSQVYYSCVESTSGTLSYVITDDGTYIIRAIFRLTEEYGSLEKIVDEIIRVGTPQRFQTIGRFGQVISLLVIGTLGMIGVATGSVPAGLILIVIGAGLVNRLGWLNMSLNVIYSLISMVIIIFMIMKRRGT
jgi:hypothetical protein